MLCMIEISLKEKIRQRDFIVVSAIGIFLLMLLSTGTASISIGGEPISGFSRMLDILVTITNSIICILAVLLSIPTITNEYKRHSSHLIWVRGISQAKYHSALAMANFLAASIAAAILYIVLFIYFVAQGEAVMVPRLLPAFAMSLINVAACTSLSSALSLFLSPLANGIVSMLFVGAGLLHGVLDTISNFSEGLSSTLIRLLLRLSPNLGEVPQMASAFIKGEDITMVPLLGVILWAYALSWILIIYHKQEA